MLPGSPGVESGNERRCSFWPRGDCLAVHCAGRHEKGGDFASPPTVPFCVDDPVGQSTLGSAGRRLISVSIIDIEMTCLVVPVSALSAKVFMA